MSGESRPQIEVYITRTFEKAFKKLAQPVQELVEDEIDRVVASPEIGAKKRGDLSHLRVHKFRINNQLVLLGYQWKEAELIITLMQLGPHENFYRDAKRR